MNAEIMSIRLMVRHRDLKILVRRNYEILFGYMAHMLLLTDN